MRTGDTATAFALQLDALGNVRSEKMRACTRDDIERILAKLPEEAAAIGVTWGGPSGGGCGRGGLRWRPVARAAAGERETVPPAPARSMRRRGVLR